MRTLWLCWSLFSLVLSTPISAFDLIGVGGYEYKPSPASPYVPTTKILKDTNLTQVNAVSLWITRDWREEWYPAKEINRSIVKEGYAPIFILYWFADDISVPYIKEHRTEYFAYLKRFRDYLDQIDGKKVIVLNPEYNEYGVEEWSGFNELLLESKKVLDHGDILIGPCVGDFGNYDNSFDVYNWKKFDPSLRTSIQAFDFIAFQEMRGLTRNSRQQIEKLPQRIESFASYLHSAYNKPVLLAYLALSTQGKDGEKLQEDVFNDISKRQEILQKSGVFGINIFHLIDVPNHKGYFNDGEKYFGIYRSNFTAKPASRYFKQIRLQKKIQ